jgi:hypothetical protein
MMLDWYYQTMTFDKFVVESTREVDPGAYRNNRSFWGRVILPVAEIARSQNFLCPFVI